MRVLVTGAYGLIGAACLARLHHDGHQVIGAGRAVEAARRRYPFAEWTEADFDRLRTAEAWRPLLASVDAVVNCVGAFQTGARDRLRHAHVDAPAALFAACEKHGVRRVIHVSAVGAATGGATEFMRGKGAAEADLAARDLDWLILRPGVVLGANVYGGTAMFLGLAGCPVVTPVVEADKTIQIVAIEDVAATVAWALRPDAALRQRFDLVHPQPLRLEEIVGGLRAWLGFPTQPVWRVPRALGRIAAVGADLLGWLGWRSPARSTGLMQLDAAIVGDPAAWIAATGIRPLSFAQILAARSATLQDRWFARLYLLKPLAIALLALFWIWTGIISLGPGWGQGMALLASTGWSRDVAAATIVAGALLDIALGAALLVQKLARRALQAMLGVSLLYLLIGAVVTPHLLVDPLAVLIKTVFVAMTALFALAIVDER